MRSARDFRSTTFVYSLSAHVAGYVFLSVFVFPNVHMFDCWPCFTWVIFSLVVNEWQKAAHGVYTILLLIFFDIDFIFFIQKCEWVLQPFATTSVDESMNERFGKINLSFKPTYSASKEIQRVLFGWWVLVRTTFFFSCPSYIHFFTLLRRQKSSPLPKWYGLGLCCPA